MRRVHRIIIAGMLAVPTILIAQPQTPQAQAEFHYRVALAALKQNDLDIALQELQKASSLAPSNALIHYNLAVVRQKKGEPLSALRSLKQAQTLGLSPAEQNLGQEMLAVLTYEIQKWRRDFLGTWSRGRASRDPRIDIDISSKGGFSYNVYWGQLDTPSYRMGIVAGCWEYDQTDPESIVFRPKGWSQGEDNLFSGALTQRYAPSVVKPWNWRVSFENSNLIVMDGLRYQRFGGQTPPDFNSIPIDRNTPAYSCEPPPR